MFRALLTALLALQTLALAAQETEGCGNSISFGLNGAAGNREALGLIAGVDACRRHGTRRSNAELEMNLVKTFDSGREDDLERVELELNHDVPLAGNWIATLEGTALADHAIGTDQRYLLGPALGQSRSGKWGNLKVVTGLTYTVEKNVSAPRESFPEAMLKADTQWKIGERARLETKLTGNVNLERGEDVRLDSEADFVLSFSERVGVKTGAEVKWDHRPAADHDQLDLTVHMLFVFQMGRGGSGRK